MNNTVNTGYLLEACHENKIKNFIYSSTASVYGDTSNRPVKENSKTIPVNPYCESKLMSENIVQEASLIYEDFRYIILRYFNVTGADKFLRIGQSTKHATHLVKKAFATALGKQKKLTICREVI